MKIVFVIRHFYPFKRPSGVISMTKELAQELKRRRLGISIICLQKPNENKKYNLKGIPIYKFKQTNPFKYRKIINKIQPNYVMFISSMVNNLSILGWWGMIRIFTPAKKILFYQATNFVKLKPSKLITSFFKSFNLVLSASNFIRAEFNKKLNLKTEIYYPSINISNLRKYFTLRTKRCCKIRSIGFFGHLVGIKGPDVVLCLAEYFFDLYFYVVAGEGTSKPDQSFSKQMKEDIKRLTNIHLFGYIKDPLSIMAKCDILVLPYRDGGTVLGVSQTALEASALGIPIIGTQNSALDSLITDGMNGYLCKDTQEMIERIETLRNSSDLYRQISINARRIVKEKFDIRFWANKLERHFN